MTCHWFRHGFRSFWFMVALLALGQALTATAAPPQQGPKPLDALSLASATAITVNYNSGTQALDFVSGSFATSGVTAEQRARDFLTRFGAAFGVRDAQRELWLIRDEADILRMRHIVFEQQYLSVPVFGARLVVHLDEGGRVRAVNGQFQPNINLDSVAPAISAEAAQTISQNDLRASAIEWQQAPRLVIWTHNQGGAAAQLAWELVGFSHAPLGRWHYFIDARTGAVAYRLNELDAYARAHEQLRPRTGEPSPTLNVVPTAKNRTVYSANNGMSLPGTFMCSEGSPSGCNSDTTAQAAFDHAGTVYNFYQNMFGRDSYDNAGAALISTVHYRVNYNNAFWSGSQMVYGDGDGVIFAPLAQDLDVVAHELTHAVTQSTSNLFYEGQSGALNESYSDVFAVFVNPANWQVGEFSYTPGVPGDSLRDLSDPTRGGQWNPADPIGSVGQPDRMAVMAVLPTWLDRSGVHINSGIPNKAAYLITNGGTFQGITTVGLGFTKAQQIYYRTQNFYNTPFTSFATAAQNTIRACQDLIGQFGINSADCTHVQNAWAAVGVLVSANLSMKAYIPLVLKNASSVQPGIYGQVTNLGAPIGGQTLALYRCTASGSNCLFITSAVTDGSGKYRFTPASLPPGYIYVVEYAQPAPRNNCALWDFWDSSWITQFASGDSVYGGDFDIHDFTRVSPSGNVAGTTQTFIWQARTLPSGMLQDLPQLQIFDNSGLLYLSAPLARGVTSRGPLSGFGVGQSYVWNVVAYGPSGAGSPLCARQFTIAAGAANPESSTAEVILPNRRSEQYPPTLDLTFR